MNRPDGAERCELEILDPSGHVTLRWTPDDPESVARAEAEFNRMRDAGFAFFVSESPDADRVEDLDDEMRARGEMDGRLEQVRRKKEPKPEKTRTFRPRASRTVAVAPMRGG